MCLVQKLASVPIFEPQRAERIKLLVNDGNRTVASELNIRLMKINGTPEYF